MAGLLSPRLPLFKVLYSDKASPHFLSKIITKRPYLGTSNSESTIFDLLIFASRLVI